MLYELRLSESGCAAALSCVQNSTNRALNRAAKGRFLSKSFCSYQCHLCLCVFENMCVCGFFSCYCHPNVFLALTTTSGARTKSAQLIIYIQGVDFRYLSVTSLLLFPSHPLLHFSFIFSFSLLISRSLPDSDKRTGQENLGNLSLLLPSSPVSHSLRRRV